MYRGPEGKKCAAGLFIPDIAYKPAFEGQTIRNLLVTYPELRGLMPLGVDLMGEFQSIHDRSNGQNTLEEMLKWIEENVA